MGLKKFIVKILARHTYNSSKKELNRAIENQKKIFNYLNLNLSKTVYGQDHHITKRESIISFQKKIPINNYERLRPYVEKVADGKRDVLWVGLPKYFAKTSGTTSGSKYIPLTKEMLKNQIRSTKEALLLYAHQTKNFDIINGKMMFIQGSPVVKKYKKIPCGRLSGIVANYVPRFLQRNRLPSMAVNSIEDWESKINNIILETKNSDLRLIGGIPPWVIMYFEKLLLNCGVNNIKEIFPNLGLYVYGGVNFRPYKNTFEKLVGNIDFLELYPASEGFIAYQNDVNKNDMLLLTNHGIFYEFIETSDYLSNKKPKRIWLKDVKINTDYVIILNTCAGLWGYNIGDTIKFTSIDPYKIVITGRVQHYISAFGEHVINSEVEGALEKTTNVLGGEIVGFTVCPSINDDKTSQGHDWFIEFNKEPEDMGAFSRLLDENMVSQNIYYKDLVQNKIIRPLKIIKIKKGGFNKYMSSIGKLGGQNKCPQLANDRKIGDYLINFSV